MRDAKVIYGDMPDGSVIFKDSKGYYIDEYDNETQKLYKKYLKNWKPKSSVEGLCYKNFNSAMTA